MILYKKVPKGAKTREIRTFKIEAEEKMERPVYIFRNERDRVKFIKYIENSLVRKSKDYKKYIQFLKKNMDMDRCIVLQKLTNGNGRKYSIEIHHEPFTLFDIVDTIIRRREACREPINPFMIADECLELHYDGKIGLIPLTITPHELVHKDKVFIPLQYVYQKYDEFYDEYEMWMDERVKDRVELKANLSLKCPDILSDVLDPVFTYVEAQGVHFPEIPDEWKNAIGIEYQESTK